jgi:hypothetical protein
MLTSDSCAGPGTQIGNAVNSTAPAAPCLLAQANFANAGVSLVAGTKYWVVVTTKSTAQQNGTTAVWWETNGPRTTSTWMTEMAGSLALSAALALSKSNN